MVWRQELTETGERRWDLGSKQEGPRTPRPVVRFLKGPSAGGRRGGKVVFVPVRVPGEEVVRARIRGEERRGKRSRVVRRMMGERRSSKFWGRLVGCSARF